MRKKLILLAVVAVIGVGALAVGYSATLTKAEPPPTFEEVNRRYGEFGSKPKFIGELNGIVFYEDRPEAQPNAAALGIPKCTTKAARQATQTEARASRLSFTFGYLPPKAEVVEDDATACQDEVVNITRSYSSPGSGWVGVVRSASRMVPSSSPREYLQVARIGGRNAVVRPPLFPKQRMAIWMRDDISLWTVSCNGMDQQECIKVAEGVK